MLDHSSTEMNYNIDWLKNKFDQGETLKYIFFWGHTNNGNEPVGKFVFSQWFPSPFVYQGVMYKTAEHWMMAGKARLFNDTEIVEKIIEANKPGEVKELGRQIKHFDPVIWDQHKFNIVKEGNIHKFSQHASLREYLVNTGDRVLVEASPVDSIWGIGLAGDSSNVENPNTWKGLNLLGFALMEVRDALRK